MTTIPLLSTAEPKKQNKNKLSKQLEQEQYHGYREHFDGCQIGGSSGGMGEELRGVRSTNG